MVVDKIASREHPALSTDHGTKRTTAEPAMLELRATPYVDPYGRLSVIRIATTVYDDRNRIWMLASDVANQLGRGDQWQRVTWAVHDGDRFEADRERVRYDNPLHTTPTGTIWMVADEAAYKVSATSDAERGKPFSEWIGRTLLGPERLGALQAAGTPLLLPPADDGGPQTLYRLYSKSRQLLYVGRSLNAANRLSQHRRDKSWWPKVVHITLEHFDGLTAVKAAEARAIRTEKPLYNKARPIEPIARVAE